MRKLFLTRKSVILHVNSLVVETVMLSIPQCNTDDGPLQLQHGEMKPNVKCVNIGNTVVEKYCI